MTEPTDPIPTRDPATYEKMRVPFASTEEGLAAQTRFREMVYRARLECRIAEVMVITVTHIDGNMLLPCVFSFGDAQMLPFMAMLGSKEATRIYAQALRDEADAVERAAEAMVDEVGSEKEP